MYIQCFCTIESEINVYNTIEHIDYVSNKILTLIYIIKSIKHLVSTDTLRTIYTSLIQPHLIYGLITWYNPNMNNTKRLYILQKMIRIITKYKYKAHIYNICERLNILKLKDIYIKQALTIYWKFLNNMLSPNLNTNLTLANQVHSHYNRHDYLFGYSELLYFISLKYNSVCLIVIILQSSIKHRNGIFVYDEIMIH